MCGVVGFLAQKASPAWRKRVLRDLLVQASSRGDQAAGIAYIDPESGLQVVKNGCRVNDFVKSDDFIRASERLPAIVIAHTRAATGGGTASPDRNENNHPFWGRDSKIAMIHNGTIDDDKWRHTVGSPGGIAAQYPFEGNTDSELFLRMVETCLDDSTPMGDAITDAAYNIEGQYALVFIRESEPNTVWFARHTAPIVLAYNPRDPYIVFGSTGQIIEHAMTNYRWHLDYFTEPQLPRLVYEEVADDTLVTVTMLPDQPWFDIQSRTFMPCERRSSLLGTGV